MQYIVSISCEILYVGTFIIANGRLVLKFRRRLFRLYLEGEIRSVGTSEDYCAFVVRGRSAPKS